MSVRPFDRVRAGNTAFPTWNGSARTGNLPSGRIADPVVGTAGRPSRFTAGLPFTPLDDDRREVVELRPPCRELAYCPVQGPDQPGSGPPGVVGQHPGQPLPAELPPRRVLRLQQAVGQEDA